MALTKSQMNNLMGFLVMFATAMYLDYERNGRFTMAGTALSFFFSPIVIIHHLLDRTSKRADCMACRA